MEPVMQVLKSSDDWSSYISKFNNIDVYYAQEYVSLFTDESEFTEAVYYKDENTKIFYPYIRRAINMLEGNYYDIVTAYGYGGPYVEGEKEKIKWFYEIFKDYCNESNIISETVRLHPLINNAEYMSLVMDVDFIRFTTGVDLTKTYDDIKKGYSDSNKRNIKKAVKNGIEVIEGGSSDDIESFIDMYYETMDKRNAGSSYYFSRDFFYKQMEDMQLGESKLLLARYNGEVVAGVIVLLGKEYAHYHLGASRTDYLYLRPNNLLFDYMIRYCQEKGARVLHLGGGYSENDSLFRFKTSFTNKNYYRFYLGKNIYNRELYDYLVDYVRRRYVINEDFFPQYRGIVSTKE